MALYGRDWELRVLAERAHAAALGEGQAVLLRGPAGIGKTKLLSTALDKLDGIAATVLTVTCADGGAAAFEATRALFDPLGPDAVVTDSADAYAVMHGMYRLVAGLAARGLVVLAVDDVHWCDEASLRWLGFLLRRSEDLPLLVLMTHRARPNEPDPEALAEIAAATNCLTIDLAPLAEDAVGDVVEAGFGAAWPLPGRLPVDTEAVARAIAVLGNEDLETVAALAGTRPGAAGNAVRTLRANELLEPDRLAFAHDQVRAAVLDAVPPAELARLRERAATLLNDSGRPSDEVAEHLLALDEPPQPWMVTVLREAAAAAESRGAPMAAARYLAQVLRADEDDVDVLVHLSRVLGQIDPATSLRHLDRALALVTDPRRRVPIAMQYAIVSLSAQNSRRSYALATEVSDALDAVIGADPAPADRALWMVSRSALLLSGLDEKATVARVGARFHDVTPPPGETAEERELLGMLASLGTLQGRPAAEVAAQAGQALRAGEVDPGGWAVVTLCLSDHPEPALTALGGVLDQAQRRGEVWTYVVGAAKRALVHQFSGDLTDALADAQYCFDVVTQEHRAPGVALPQAVLGSLLVRMGDPDGAEQVLATVVRPRFEEFTLEYHWYLMAKARARAALGDAEGALAALRTCGESLTSSGIGNPVLAPWWYEAAELLAGLGRIAEGEAVLDAVEPAVRRWGTARALGMLETSRGVLTDGDAAVERLLTAADLLAGSPAKLEQAKAEYLLGRRLLLRGDAEGARERLRRSIDLSVLSRDKQQLGLSLPALAEAGGRMRHGTESPSDALSGSERRVAEQAAAGATNREIAESLFITQRTVEVHLTSVYRKLGIGGRGELAAALRDI